MKKVFFLLLINIISVAAIAQYKLTLVLSATPPATLNVWATKREVLTLLVSGQGSATTNLLIKTQLKTTDGTVIGTSDLAKARQYTFVNASTVLTAADVLPLENMIFTGKYKNTLDKTGKLPADNYMLCVQLVRPVDYAPASDAVCKNFYVAALQLPILTKPYDGEVLDIKIAQTAVIFRWTPLVPSQSTIPTYRIQVFEVLENQHIVQALRSNQPLLDKEIKGATQYIWTPQLGLIQSKNTDTSSSEKNINTSEAGVGTGKGGIKKATANGNGEKNINTSEDNLGSGKATFVWTIQTLDANGLPVIVDGNGEARSEPKFFVMSTHAHK